jgi:hypothetical protein
MPAKTLITEYHELTARRKALEIRRARANDPYSRRAVEIEHSSYERAVKAFNDRANEINRKGRVAAEAEYFRQAAHNQRLEVIAKARAAAEDAEQEAAEAAAHRKAVRVRRDMTLKNQELIKRARDAGLPAEADRLEAMTYGRLPAMFFEHRLVETMLGDTPTKNIARQAIDLAIERGYPVEAASIRYRLDARESDDQILNTVEHVLSQVLAH